MQTLFYILIAFAVLILGLLVEVVLWLRAMRADAKDLRQRLDWRDDELRKALRYLAKQHNTRYTEVLTTVREHQQQQTDDIAAEVELLLDEAKRIVIEAGKCSTSYLQRKLRIGYARAACLVDLLEDEGVVGPVEGSQPRVVLVGDVDAMDNE